MKGPKRSAIDTAPLMAICAGLILAALPLVEKVAPWALAIFAGAVLARLLVNHLQTRLPNLPLRIAVLTIGLGGIALSYGSLLGIEAGLGILLILLSLKLLETNTVRDFQVLTLLGWFLSLCALFFAQDLLMWLYIGAVCALLTAALVRFHCGNAPQAFRRSLRMAFTLAVQAVPIVVLLFLLFPRAYGGFRFSLSRGAGGVTGMSDRVEPGSIARLALNTDTAFRADFPDGDVPPLSQMYWRGAVLWRGDGLTWVRGPHMRAEPSLGGKKVRQRISLEPHGGVWMLALDRPATRPKGAYFEAGGYLQRDQPVMSRLHYEVISRLENKEVRLFPEQLKAAMTLPTQVTPRVEALAKSWVSRGESPREIVENGLRWFRREKFSYTLTPGMFGSNGLEEFLFQRRQGFCEHYAAAFATLMRVAGLPSRLVVGYQGGEFNTHGKYVVVRQSDAHAWAEVWIQGDGWLRVDPTNVIAPERISSGSDSFFQGRVDSLSGIAQRSTSVLGLRDLLREMRLIWDNLNYQWDLRVLNFDEETQRSVFAIFRLQNSEWPALLTWITLGIAFSLSMVALWLRRPRIVPRGVEFTYTRFCRLLSRAGLPRHPWEGPGDLGRRAAAEFPEAGAAIHRITDAYTVIRYGREPGSEADLKSAIRALPKLIRDPTVPKRDALSVK